ncbi:hypothetical protein V6N13_130757 [Hibiscus sabdariffa]
MLSRERRKKARNDNGELGSVLNNVNGKEKPTIPIVILLASAIATQIPKERSIREHLAPTLNDLMPTLIIAECQSTDAPPCFNQNVIPQRAHNNLPPVQESSDDNTLMNYVEHNDATVQSLEASMRNLEVQIGQIASDTSSDESEELNLLDDFIHYFDRSELLELAGREIRAPRVSSEEPSNLELK